MKISAKFLKQTIFFAVAWFVIWSQLVAVNNLSFKNRISALEIAPNATMNFDKPVFNYNGTLVKAPNATVSGMNIAFKGGILEDQGNSLLITGTYNTTGILDLRGSDSFRGIGKVLQTVSVQNSANRIEGQPQFTGDITLLDSSAGLTIAIQSVCGGNINLNSGRLRLEDKLSFLDQKQIVGPGIVECNNNKLDFGGKPLTFSASITWSNATDVNLTSHTSLSSTWTFIGTNNLNGHGNVLDLSSGGDIVVDAASTLYLTDIAIKGAGDLIQPFWLLSGDSKMVMSNVFIELGRNLTTTCGSIYVEGPTTWGMKNYSWTFNTAGTLTVDGTTLWKDGMQNSLSGGIAFGTTLANYLTLLNSGTIKQVANEDLIVVDTAALDTRITNTMNNIWSQYLTTSAYLDTRITNTMNNIWSDYLTTSAYLNTELSNTYNYLDNRITTSVTYLDVKISNTMNNIWSDYLTTSAYLNTELSNTYNYLDNRITTSVTYLDVKISNTMNNIWSDYLTTSAYLNTELSNTYNYLDNRITISVTYLDVKISNTMNNIWSDYLTTSAYLNTELSNTYNYLDNRITTSVTYLDVKISNTMNNIWSDYLTTSAYLNTELSNTYNYLDNRITISVTYLDVKISNTMNNIWSDYLTTSVFLNTQITSTYNYLDTRITNTMNNIWSQYLTTSVYLDNRITSSVTYLDVKISNTMNNIWSDYLTTSVFLNTQITSTYNYLDTRITNTMNNIWSQYLTTSVYLDNRITSSVTYLDVKISNTMNNIWSQYLTTSIYLDNRITNTMNDVWDDILTLSATNELAQITSTYNYLNARITSTMNNVWSDYLTTSAYLDNRITNTMNDIWITVNSSSEAALRAEITSTYNYLNARITSTMNDVWGNILTTSFNYDSRIISLEEAVFGINLYNANGNIILNQDKGVDFTVHASLALSLTLSNESAVYMYDESTELKLSDTIYVIGRNNTIDVTKTLTINGLINFDTGGELIFNFDDKYENPIVYFGRDLTLPELSRLAFANKGTAVFKDGTTIHFDSSVDANRPALAVTNNATLMIDERLSGHSESSLTLRGLGIISIIGGEIFIDSLKHLIIGGGDTTTDRFDIYGDSGGALSLLGVGSKISIHKAYVNLDFEQAGIIYIGQYGTFEINSLDLVSSPGTLNNFKFILNGELWIYNDGKFVLGDNISDSVINLNTTGATIGGYGVLQYLTSSSFSGRLYENNTKELSVTAKNLISNLLQRQTNLTTSVLFWDANGNQKVRLFNGNIATLDAADLVTQDASSGIVYGTRGGKGFRIDLNGNITRF